jgi:hypothetical protein
MDAVVQWFGDRISMGVEIGRLYRLGTIKFYNAEVTPYKPSLAPAFNRQSLIPSLQLPIFNFSIINFSIIDFSIIDFPIINFPIIDFQSSMLEHDR